MVYPVLRARSRCTFWFAHVFATQFRFTAARLLPGCAHGCCCVPRCAVRCGLRCGSAVYRSAARIYRCTRYGLVATHALVAVHTRTRFAPFCGWLTRAYRTGLRCVIPYVTTHTLRLPFSFTGSPALPFTAARVLLRYRITFTLPLPGLPTTYAACHAVGSRFPVIPYLHTRTVTTRLPLHLPATDYYLHWITTRTFTCTTTTVHRLVLRLPAYTYTTAIYRFWFVGCLILPAVTRFTLPLLVACVHALTRLRDAWTVLRAWFVRCALRICRLPWLRCRGGAGLRFCRLFTRLPFWFVLPLRSRTTHATHTHVLQFYTVTPHGLHTLPLRGYVAAFGYHYV